MIPAFYFGSSVVYACMDNGLADLMGLETLCHGTNPYNNLSIRIHGGDPAHGGKLTGGTPEGHHGKQNVKGFFYMTQDNEMKTRLVAIDKDNYLGDLILGRIVRYFVPSYFKGLSGGWSRAFKVKNRWVLNKENSVVYNILLLISGLASCLITSTLHFRFASIDPQRLEDDPDWSIMAYRTRQKVEWWRIGFFGSLVVLCTADNNWLTRIKKHPYKLAGGLAKLTAATAACVLAAPVVMSSTPLMVAAVAGALIS